MTRRQQDIKTAFILVVVLVRWLFRFGCSPRRDHQTMSVWLAGGSSTQPTTQEL